ncbi:MAG: DEAD/DEAH box helicase family protein [Acidobacteriota bacterium]|nr:DEAD/DEAH box helicase family protein [Acidobacteriota bacterium]
MLRALQYKGVYKSDTDNLLEDFYLPTLSVANRYDRAVGFFSASTISYAAQALSAFVKNSGQIRLILGAFLDKEDVGAISEGYRRREISQKIGAELLSVISNVSDELFQNRIDTLAWLVAHGRLDVKIALRERGMYHDKIGVIGDEADDKIVFSGSANESSYALLPAFNYESINVFPCWCPELKAYTEPHIESFERLWSNHSPATAVVDIPTAIKERLVSVARTLSYTPDPEIERAIAARVREKVRYTTSSTSSRPREPKTMNGRPFKMHAHQIEALEAWKARGDFHGTFELATGSGKTITAIHAVVKLSEKIDRLACVIAVPYQNLADQWIDTLSGFNIYPIRCYVSRGQWHDKLRNVVHELVMGSCKFVAIVVVNRTLKTPEFQECLKQLKGNRLLWIGDECHHHTSKAYEGFLPEQARYRIGLSATPEHYLDEERNDRLAEFYGEIVFRYTLRQAIEDKILTPYTYYPHIVTLTASEAEEFIELSEKIGRIFARQENIKAVGLDKQLKVFLLRRARLVGSAVNKLPVLKNVLAGVSVTPHTLFYCGDGTVETDEEDKGNGHQSADMGQRQVEATSSLLHQMGWDVSRFTSRESRRDRQGILENFKVGIIKAMVAIRCLDEGIDVPACNIAYILASSRDPRQFVQRRGRILRRSPGKEMAIIHDFIVVLKDAQDDESEYAKRLIKSELARVAEFSSLSRNRAEAYETLAPILRQYDLEHMV